VLPVRIPRREGANDEEREVADDEVADVLLSTECHPAGCFDERTDFCPTGVLSDPDGSGRPIGAETFSNGSRKRPAAGADEELTAP
jgi:hypothetical protein